MTPIQRFLNGKVIFVTGATGFLAKGLVEKLLRHAPHVGRIYLLVRPKGRSPDPQADAQARLENEILRSSAFSRLRQEFAGRFTRFAREKLVAVAGDLTRDGLGIDPEVYERLTREVDVVVNSAATVVFDERVDEALQLNTLGPRRLLKLARDCRDAIFVHVSTAYVNGRKTGPIPETMLAPNSTIAQVMGNGRGRRFDLDAEIEWIGSLPEQVERASRTAELQAQFRRTLDKRNRGKRLTVTRVAHQMEGVRSRWVSKRLVDVGMARARKLGWYDNYTYTKAMGEQVIARERGDLPTVIVRPSIIESSLEDPEPGWLEGLKVADPLITHYGKGRLPDMPANPLTILDLIPVDIVVNAIIAALPGARDSRSIQVFQVATGSENPLILGETFDYLRDYFTRNPLRDREGKPIDVPQWNFPSLRKFRMGHRFKYQLPLTTLDRLMSLMPALPWSPSLKTKVSSLAMRGRLLSLTEIYSPYMNLKCTFSTANTRRLYRDLDPEDQALFNLDVSRIRWREYIQDIHLPGLKRHVWRIDDSALPYGREAAARQAERL